MKFNIYTILATGALLLGLGAFAQNNRPTQTRLPSRLPVAPKPVWGQSPELQKIEKGNLGLPLPQTFKKRPAQASSEPIWLYGNVTSTAEPLDEPLIGIYRYQLNSTSHNRERVHIDQELRGLYGNAAWTPEGYHIAVRDPYAGTNTHRIYDYDTWQILHEKVLDSRLTEFNSSAWDWQQGLGAALCISDSAWAIHDFCHFLEYTDFTRTEGFPIILKNGLLRAIAVDTDGTAFGIDYNGILYRLDPHTRSLVTIGNTGLPTPYDTSMYLDPLTHTLYYVQNDQITTLWSLDTETAQATHIWDFPWKEQIFGLYTHQPLAKGAAPAAPQPFTLSFPQGTLQGQLTFTAPAKTYSGDNLSGALNFHIQVDRHTVREGSVAAGATKTVDLGISEGGWHKVTLSLSNASGESPYTTADYWFGPDYVQTVQKPTLTYLGENKVRLTWEPCIQGQHGGFVDPDAVTYDILRYPGEVSVATGLTACEFTETLDLEQAGPVAVQYAVRSNAGDLQGVYTDSEKVVVGHATTPYDFPMGTEADALLFTPVDSDQDGFSWRWINKMWVEYYNPYTLENRNDWLLTAPIEVEKGKSYLLSLDICGHDASEPHQFSISGGFAPNPDALTENILPVTELPCDNSNPAHIETWVTPTETGKYYLGIHTAAHPACYYLYLRSMHLSEGVIAGVAREPEDFVVYTHTEGGTKAYGRLTVPSMLVNGLPATDLQYISVRRDGSEVYRLDNPEPGKTIEFTDMPKRTGRYTYTALAMNSAGEGLTATVEAYIGNTTPGQVMEAEAQHAGEGVSSVSWTTPQVSASGSPINPDLIWYSLWEASSKTCILENVKGNTATLPTTDAPQRFEQIGVRSHMKGGEAERLCYSNPVPVGTPYQAPYADSFPEAEPATMWMSQSLTSSARWFSMDDSQSITSADADGGFMVFSSPYEGGTARLTGGYIQIPEENPTVTLQYYCQPDSRNTLEFQVHDGTGWHTIHTVYVNEGTPDKWNTASFVVPEQWRGATVQIGILGRTDNYIQSYLDNITLAVGSDTSVPEVSAITPEAFTATAANGRLTITPAGAPVLVYTPAGVLVAIVREPCTIALAAGTYLCTCRQTTKKVIL